MVRIKADAEIESWTSPMIDSVKANVLQEVDRTVSLGDASMSRLEAILARLRELPDQGDSSTLLQRFVLSMSALAEHLRQGGLRPTDVSRLSESIRGILLLQKIHPTSSRLGFLHCQHQALMSQLHQEQGELWQSAWCQYLAEMWSKYAPRHDQFLHLRGMGRRNLRIGFGKGAMQQLTDALKIASTDPERLTVLNSLANAARLCGQIQQWQELRQQLQSQFAGSLDPLEWEWEDQCHQVAHEKCSVKELNRLTQIGRPHHHASYVVEARLYTYASTEKSRLTDLRKMSTLIRTGVLTQGNSGVGYRALAALEDCYDYDIPLEIRLQGLEGVLQRTGELASIEKELLVLGAAARWLHRSHISQLRELVMHRYRSLVFGLTGQDRTDPLGIVQDIL